jgi:methyltransferase (TIGR00027 family)
MNAETALRNISDTALWAAIYRARESGRPDALFRDPLARRLAGHRGEEIVSTTMRSHDKHEWAWVMRTVLFDRFIAAEIAAGVDLIVNLAAGLDARPYRMTFPTGLRWVEVDLPDLLAYKNEVLRGEKPACALERVALDLADIGARRELFGQLGRDAKKALVITEGLLVYLTGAEAGALAQDLARPESFQGWVLDVLSPGLLRMLQREIGSALEQAQAPLKFGPPEGPEFFERFGWHPEAVASPFGEAARRGRLPFLLKLVALLPEPRRPKGNRPWSGVCLMRRAR